MALAREEIRARAPAWPSEAPFWPCLYFLYGEHDEIVSVLFFDSEDAAQGHPVDEQGVVQWDEPADVLVGEPPGWCVQVLAVTKPDPWDPRRAAPSVDALGSDLPLREAYMRALDLTAERGIATGETFEESLSRLLWRLI